MHFHPILTPPLQVATAMERAKQVTMTDLNSVVASAGAPQAPPNAPGGGRPDMLRLMQLHAQAQAGQAGLAGLAGLQNGAAGLPPGLAGLPPNALAHTLAHI